MIDHEPFRFLAAKDVGGALTPVEAGELELHLADCPACRADAAAMRRDHLMLVASVVDAPVAPRVRQKVMETLETGRRGGWLLPVLVAVALLLAVLLATGSSSPARDPRLRRIRSPVTGRTATARPCTPCRFTDPAQPPRRGPRGVLGPLRRRPRVRGGQRHDPAAERDRRGVLAGRVSRWQQRCPVHLSVYPRPGHRLARRPSRRDLRSIRPASPAVVAPSSSQSSAPASTTPEATTVIPAVAGSFTYVVREGAGVALSSIDAAGTAPVRGTWSFQALPDGAIQSGSVTCLAVRGNEAFAFGAPGTGGRAAFFWLQDGDGPEAQGIERSHGCRTWRPTHYPRASSHRPRTRCRAGAATAARGSPASWIQGRSR